jgi:hypothetical protein
VHNHHLTCARVEWWVQQDEWRAHEAALEKQTLQACTAGSVYDAVNFNHPTAIHQACLVVIIQIILTCGTVAAAHGHFAAEAMDKADIARATAHAPTCVGQGQHRTVQCGDPPSSLSTGHTLSTAELATIFLLDCVLLLWVRNDSRTVGICLRIKTRATKVFGGLLFVLECAVLLGNTASMLWTYGAGGSTYDMIMNGVALLMILDLDEKFGNDYLAHGILDDELTVMRASAAGDIQLEHFGDRTARVLDSTLMRGSFKIKIGGYIGQVLLWLLAISFVALPSIGVRVSHSYFYKMVTR